MKLGVCIAPNHGVNCILRDIAELIGAFNRCQRTRKFVESDDYESTSMIGQRNTSLGQRGLVPFLGKVQPSLVFDRKVFARFSNQRF